MFGKTQHFQSKSLKSYKEMVKKIEWKIIRYCGINFKMTITGWKHFALSTLWDEFKISHYFQDMVNALLRQECSPK